MNIAAALFLQASAAQPSHRGDPFHRRCTRLFVADFPVAHDPAASPLFGGEGGTTVTKTYAHRPAPRLPSLPAPRLDLFVADFNIEVADDGIFAHPPFRDVELNCRVCSVNEPSVLHTFPELSRQNPPLSTQFSACGASGICGALSSVINVVFQLFDDSQPSCSSAQHCSRGLPPVASVVRGSSLRSYGFQQTRCRSCGSYTHGSGSPRSRLHIHLGVAQPE